MWPATFTGVIPRGGICEGGGSYGTMANLSGHAAGNGGYRQGDPTVSFDSLLLGRQHHTKPGPRHGPTRLRGARGNSRPYRDTEPDLPNMMLGQTAHFRVLSLRNYYAKWCADSLIAQRLLAQRPRDSGQFRSLLDEEMLGAGLHQRTNWPTSYSKILESRESLSVPDVREFSFRGNPG